MSPFTHRSGLWLSWDWKVLLKTPSSQLPINTHGFPRCAETPVCRVLAFETATHGKKQAVNCFEADKIPRIWETTLLKPTPKPQTGRATQNPAAFAALGCEAALRARLRVGRARQAAAVPLSCLQSLEWELHRSRAADRAQRTPSTLNDYRQCSAADFAFCTGHATLPPLLLLLLVPGTTPLRDHSHTGWFKPRRTRCHQLKLKKFRLLY